jgi:hypothetical protein
LKAAADAEQLELGQQQYDGEAAVLAAAGAAGQGADAALLLEGGQVGQGGLQVQGLSDGAQLQQQVPVTALQQQQLEANKRLAEVLGEWVLAARWFVTTAGIPGGVGRERPLHSRIAACVGVRRWCWCSLHFTDVLATVQAAGSGCRRLSDRRSGLKQWWLPTA